MSSRAIRFSIVIPARNEAKVIARCLDALVQLDCPSEAMEVIVVDNGSTDQTLTIASTYRGRLNLTITEHPSGYISAVRNHGAAMATGDILVFLDADCVPSKKWLTLAESLCSSRRIIGAFYSIPPESSWVAQAWYGFECTDKNGPVSFVPSGDLIVYRETFVRIGGFDETIETNEDCDFCERAQDSGFEVVAFPELSVTHFGTPQTLSGFYRKQRWHGRHVLAVTLRDLRAFRNRRAISFAVYTLACILIALVGLSKGLISGGFELLASAILAMLLAPAMLSATKAMHHRNIGEFLPLTVLFLIYGIARARCLLDLDALKFKVKPGRIGAKTATDTLS